MEDINHSQTEQRQTPVYTSDKGTKARTTASGRVQRTHKDTLFRFIFRDKEKLLKLYNALNESDYQDPDELEITTMEDILYLGYRNDLSFLIDWVMFLGEHQSTWNPNMCLRGMLYFARLYHGYVEANHWDMYGSTLIRLPFPKYTVFYNGKREQPERMTMSLSEAFQVPERLKERNELPALECRALVLNINYGKNRRLMENCRPLMEYAKFVHYVRQNIQAGKTPGQAVDLAVDACLKENILTDVLRVHRREVVELSLNDFYVEIHEKNLRREGYEEGATQAEERFSRLVEHLLKEKRMDDLTKALHDKQFRDSLIQELQI